MKLIIVRAMADIAKTIISKVVKISISDFYSLNAANSGLSKLATFLEQKR